MGMKPLLRFLGGEVVVPGFSPSEGWEEVEPGRYVKEWKGRGAKVTAQAEGEKVRLSVSPPTGIPRKRHPRSSPYWLLEVLKELEECASFPPRVTYLSFLSGKSPEEVKAKISARKVEVWGKELKLAETLQLPQGGCRVTFKT